MSFRIADLIGDLGSSDATHECSALNKTSNYPDETATDKAIVSSTSEESARTFVTGHEPPAKLNRRIGAVAANNNSAFGPVNLANNRKTNHSHPVPFLPRQDATSTKLGLSTFEDYASKLYSSIYYDYLYSQPPAIIPSSAVATYGSIGLEKTLSSTYQSLYPRSRPGWAGLYPAPSQAPLTHHPLSPFFPPLVYAHYSKRKGGQVRFTTSQTDTLEKRFQSHKYLSPEDRRVLAEALKLSDRQVKTWFQNRRAKWRRCHDGCDRHSEALDGHSSDSDPEHMRSLSPDHQLDSPN